MTDVINGVPRDWLKQLHRDLDACQKLIWANLRGCDPAYCADAQARLAEIETMLATAQPAADGEREAFEAWAASVGYHTERDMFQREKYQSSLTWELWRVWQSSAAQPQQAVAVTDEVRRLREALEFYANGDHLLLADPDEWDTCSGEPVNWLHDEAGTASVEDGSVAKAALSAHKTGEEE